MNNKIVCFVFTFLFLATVARAADTVVFSENGKFGLKNGETIVTKAQYKKLISLGDTSYIALKGSKYGLVDEKGNILLDFKYTHASRMLGKFVRLKNFKGYGLYDEFGNTIVPQNHDTIELLPGGMLLVSNKYKYGVMDLSGNVLIKNVCDDIYTPKSNIMRIKYDGEWYEIEQLNAKTLTLPADVKNIKSNSAFKITKLVTCPAAASKYSVVAATDYSLKLISSISPAYEATIDEIMLSQGAEAVSVIMRLAWLPMFPVVYARNYYKIYRNPNNGPLADVKSNLRHELE